MNSLKIKKCGSETCITNTEMKPNETFQYSLQEMLSSCVKWIARTARSQRRLTL